MFERVVLSSHKSEIGQLIIGVQRSGIVLVIRLTGEEEEALNEWTQLSPQCLYARLLSLFHA